MHIVRCTFPPGAVHVCHSHPGYQSYVVNGGKGQVQDEKGIRKIDVVSGAPSLWHEFANVGDTTIQFVVIEKKYQVVSPSGSGCVPEARLTAGTTSSRRRFAQDQLPQAVNISKLVRDAAVGRVPPLLPLDPVVAAVAPVGALRCFETKPSSPIRQAASNSSGPISPCSKGATKIPSARPRSNG